MSLLSAYESIVALGARPAYAPRVAEMRRVFEERTGRFGPEDAWFEARSRAFWDDAVTRQGFAREVEADLPADARPLVGAFARAHRGLFMIDGRLLRDLWGGAEFLVDTIDDAMRDALAAAAAPFDARLVAHAPEGGTPHVTLLPGAVFHPEDATDPIAKVLEAARAAAMDTDATLDALLRMERSLRSLSRVKAGYAYRVSGLDPRQEPRHDLRHERHDVAHDRKGPARD